MKTVSRYASSSPATSTKEADEPVSKSAVMCDELDCTSYFPPKSEGGDRKPRCGVADVIFTNRFGLQIAKCCYHYDVALYRAGRGRMSRVTGAGTELTVENTRENYARVDAAEREQDQRRARVLAAERESARASA